jgi:hypothetical protein
VPHELHGSKVTLPVDMSLTYTVCPVAVACIVKAAASTFTSLVGDVPIDP